MVYRDIVLADSPIAFWRLGEASGTTAVDEVGTHDATYVGSPTLGEAGALVGDADTAVDLPTASDYVDCGDDDAFSPITTNDEFSIECWVRIDDAGVFYAKGDTDNWEYQLQVNMASVGWRMTLFDTTSSGGVYDRIDYLPSVIPGPTDWTHLVVTCDGSTMRLYENGVEVASTPQTVTSRNGTAPLFLGGRAAMSAFFNGSLDECAYYGYGLSSEQVLTHYQAGTDTLAPVIEFAWSGGIDATSAVVKARVRFADDVDLKLATDAAMISPSTFPGTLVADDVWEFELTGLTANTQYYYGIESGGETWSEQGKLHTFPSGQASFTLASASCAGNIWAEFDENDTLTSNAPTFELIRQRAPLFFLHMGDFHYQDIPTDEASDYRTAYQDVMDNPRQAGLYREVPIAYAWDDHDYAPNNGDSTHIGRETAQQVFREYVPHYDLPGTDGQVFQTFVAGRVRFVLIDSRSDRTPNSATDDASKTLLGAEQKQWVKDTLLAADEPVIVLMVAVPWIVDEEIGGDNWGAFTTERQELAEFFEANNLTERILLLHGDVHMLAGDDGTNTQYDPASVNPGPVLACFAPLDAGAATRGGPYSEGTYLDTNQQYGTIDVDDQGTQIVLTMRGWEVDALTDPESPTETEVMTFSATFADTNTNTVVAATATASAQILQPDSNATVLAATALAEAQVEQAQFQSAGYYESAVIVDGPVGYWRLGEAAGDAIDHSGNGHDAQYVDVLTGNRDVTGALHALQDDGAVRLTDSSDRVTTGEVAALTSGLNAGNAFTLEVWARLSIQDGSNTSRGLIQAFDAAGNLAFRLYRRGTRTLGSVNVQLRSSAGDEIAQFPSESYDAFDWQHHVVTFDGSDVRLYRNGALVDVAVLDVDLDMATAEVVFGHYPDEASTTFRWVGDLDEVAIYPTALSAARVAEHYEAASRVAILVAPDAVQANAEVPAHSFANVVVDAPASASASVLELERLVVDAPGSFIELMAEDQPLIWFRLGETGEPTDEFLPTIWPTLVPAYDQDAYGMDGVERWEGENLDPDARGLPGAIFDEEDDGCVYLGGATGLSMSAQVAIEGLNGQLVADDTGEITFEAWIKRDDDDSGKQYIFRFHPYDDGWDLGIHYGELSSGMNLEGSRWAVRRTAGYVTHGEWHHVVATLDSNMVRRHYIDGELVGEWDEGKRWDSDNHYFKLQAFAIGRASTSPSGYFKGSVDEVAVYNHALAHDRLWRHWYVGPTAYAIPDAVILPPAIEAGAEVFSPFTGTIWPPAIGSEASWVYRPETRQDVRQRYRDEVIFDSPRAYYKLDVAVDDGTAIPEETNNILPEMRSLNGVQFGEETPVDIDAPGALFEYQDGESTNPRISASTTNIERLTSQLPGNNQVSWEAWVRPRSFGFRQCIIGLQPDGSGYRVFIEDDGTLSSLFSWDVSFQYRFGGELVADEWQHVVVTYDGQVRRHYINGVVVAEWDEGGKTLDFNDEQVDQSGWGRLAIGALGGFNGQYLEGWIDEVSFYPHALDPMRVFTHYESGLALFYDGEVDPVVGALAAMDEHTVQVFKEVFAETGTASTDVPGHAVLTTSNIDVAAEPAQAEATAFPTGVQGTVTISPPRARATAEGGEHALRLDWVLEAVEAHAEAELLGGSVGAVRLLAPAITASAEIAGAALFTTETAPEQADVHLATVSLSLAIGSRTDTAHLSSQDATCSVGAQDADTHVVSDAITLRTHVGTAMEVG